MQLLVTTVDTVDYTCRSFFKLILPTTPVLYPSGHQHCWRRSQKSTHLSFMTLTETPFLKGHACRIPALNAILHISCTIHCRWCNHNSMGSSKGRTRLRKSKTKTRKVERKKRLMKKCYVEPGDKRKRKMKCRESISPRYPGDH
ncbi:hypothetical protein PoB_004979400 [Plakobranchus ocellatus]|uniref:Uncharacterized protein n=1 Tax=Plakobranchus ocellatus TaxID=259542 RepID=A0AAV4BWV7_9GAST|nr:hypothetical protein PoB_004979400 [Plakobranchus ocellatus]